MGLAARLPFTHYVVRSLSRGAILILVRSPHNPSLVATHLHTTVYIMKYHVDHLLLLMVALLSRTFFNLYRLLTNALVPGVLAGLVGWMVWVYYAAQVPVGTDR